MNDGSNPFRPPRPPLQARRIRAIAISLPIMILSGYTIINRFVNSKTAPPPPRRNPEEGSKKEETVTEVVW
ncbi:hypothetical protein B0H19DRAFT_1167437 [Mycena capillaripes]|nr:hypothetical protein B0H19DRAFT_1167437 [Mycena capillaripes]